MKRYEFFATLPGYGETLEEAWEDAIEVFRDDPGDFPDGWRVTDLDVDTACRKVK